MSSKKYLGENSKEEAKTETKYMLLSQLTNAFLIVNNLLKKKKKLWKIRTSEVTRYIFLH